MPSCLNRFPVPSLWTRRRTKKNDTHTSLTKTLLVAETPLFAYDAPPSYNASSAVFDEAVLKTIEREIEVQNNALRELSLDIHGKRRHLQPGVFKLTLVARPPRTQVGGTVLSFIITLWISGS